MKTFVEAIRVRMLDEFRACRSDGFRQTQSRALMSGLVILQGCAVSMDGHGRWWVHIHSPPVASRGLLRKILRNYFGFNSDKRPTAKHWLGLIHLLEALRMALLSISGVF